VLTLDPVTTPRRERGFTLMEVLVAMAIGTIVLTSAFTLVDQALPASKRITARVDATQRGRIALENMVRSLGSAVCVPNGVDGTGAAAFLPPIAAPSDDNQITFYAQTPTPTDVTQNTFAPEMRQYQLTGGSLVEKRWTGTLHTGSTNVYDFTLASTRTLLSNVSAGSGPVFSYQAYDSTGALATLPAGAVASADLPRIVTMKISFVAAPGDGTNTAQGATLSDAVTIGLPVNFTDASTMQKGPECTV
jgi:prepilin-type N-terminal cleavage/methylation domain-containing protein